MVPLPCKIVSVSTSCYTHSEHLGFMNTPGKRGLGEAGCADWVRMCRDIFTVRLTPGKGSSEARMSSETVAPFICPVTDLSCLRYPFAALPDCGHAFSNRAISQV